MKGSLVTGLETTFSFLVPETKTVPRRYPEPPQFQTMPEVFATASHIAFRDAAFECHCRGGGAAARGNVMRSAHLDRDRRMRCALA